MRDLVKFRTVDEYLRLQSPAVARLLQQLRETILKSAPGAEETISYNMPAYKLDGPLVYFAGYEHHIGFYPTPSAIDAFKEELAKFTLAKGTVRFEIDKPLPVGLIRKMVSFRVKENKDKAQAKAILKRKKA